ncbi:HAD-IA family hydrolase [Candidatus Daviesbacteria bacterium]|nr:HAD-IA family hydrolase [Candidatus Daviesbacteria bacterium]
MKQAVLFDIDGTLLNTWDYVMKAFMYTLLAHGIDKTEKEISSVFGKTLKECYEILAPGSDPLILCKLHDEYQTENPHLVKPFPGLKLVLDQLRTAKFSIAAVTNRSKNTLYHSLKGAQIYDYFDVILAVEDVKNPKPHPEHALTALKQLNINPKRAYIVGDTEVDVTLGKNARIKTVAVTYGFGGKNMAHAGADFVIDDLGDLMKIIQNP